MAQLSDILLRYDHRSDQALGMAEQQFHQVRTNIDVDTGSVDLF